MEQPKEYRLDNITFCQNYFRKQFCCGEDRIANQPLSLAQTVSGFRVKTYSAKEKKQQSPASRKESSKKKRTAKKTSKKKVKPTKPYDTSIQENDTPRIRLKASIGSNLRKEVDVEADEKEASQLDLMVTRKKSSAHAKTTTPSIRISKQTQTELTMHDIVVKTSGIQYSQPVTLDMKKAQPFQAQINDIETIQHSSSSSEISRPGKPQTHIGRQWRLNNDNELEEIKVYQCKCCDKIFLNGPGLGGHMSRAHNNESTAYKHKMTVRKKRAMKRCLHQLAKFVEQ